MITVNVDPVNDTVGLVHLKNRYEMSPPAALFDFIRCGLFHQSLTKVCSGRKDEQLGVVLTDPERITTCYFGTFEEMRLILVLISIFPQLFEDHENTTPRLLVEEVEGLIGGKVQLPDFSAKIGKLRLCMPYDMRKACLLALGSCDEADVLVGSRKLHEFLLVENKFVEVLEAKYDMPDGAIADLIEILRS